MRRKPTKLKTVESWAFDSVSEKLSDVESAEPHVCVPDGKLALVTYRPDAGSEERVEVVRAGQVVRATLGDGWQFARGTIVRV
jgi:hypothetical protein